MIEITTEQFEQLLPMVGTASEDVFLKMQPSFAATYADMIDSTIGEEYEEQACAEGSPLAGYVRNFVILSTFLQRLRSHDLILTDTGFGIVSNENIAPASQARVDALEHELRCMADVALYGAINRLRLIDGWADTVQAYATIKSFVWCPLLLRQWCGARHDATSDDLARLLPDIYAAENALRRELSAAQIDELLAEERRAAYKPSHREAIMHICRFIGMRVDANASDGVRHIDVAEQMGQVLQFVEDHISDFPIYRNSPAYRANHMDAYENKTDDPTFFFGC